MASVRLQSRVADRRVLFQGILLAGLLPTFVFRSEAQISVVSSNAATNQFSASYFQDFNTLRSSGTGTWINNSTLQGWYASYQNSSNLTIRTSGAGSGDLASYGSGTERSLGACPGSSTPIYLAFRLVNGTTYTLTGLTFGYDLEKTGSGNVSTTVAYQIFNAGAGSATSGTWTSVTSVAAGGNGFSHALANLPLAAGQEIWIRWQFSRTSGNATVMAVDNLSVSSLVWASSSTAPVIQQQPASLVTEDGGAVTFSVQASGNPPPSFQWRFNGSNLSAATNSSLVLDPVSPSNAGSYDVVVSNSAGSVTSTAATLSIRAASPSFVPAGGTFTNSASVTLISSTAGSSVRYTTDGTTPTSSTGTLYTGPFTLNQSAVVRAVAVGTGLAESSVASASFEILRRPVMVTQPSSLTVLEGDAASFSVLATGNPAPAYQWRFGGTEIAGATNSLFMVQPATAASSGAYDVVITNGIGTVVTESAWLSVQARAPTLSPTPGTYSNSVILTLTPVTTGTTIRYTVDGSTPSATNGLIYSAPIQFTSNVSLRAAAYGAGLLDSAVVSGSYTVLSAPAFSGGLELVAGGTSLTNARSVPVTGSYMQGFGGLVSSGTATWNDDLSSNPTVLGWSANRSTYSFSTGTTANGLYSSGSSANPWLAGVPTAGGGSIHAGLRLVNRSGSTIQGLKVLFDANRVSGSGSNTIILLQKKFVVGQGSLTNLPATNGNAADPISDYSGWTETGRIFGLAANTSNVTFNLSSLSWVDGEELWLGWMFIKAGGSTTMVGIDNVRIQEFSLSSATNPVTNSAPLFTASPSSLTVVEGATASFSATVSGSPTPALQWSRNGSVVSGATNSLLVLTNVQGSQGGTYQLVASNSVGTSTNSAILTVRAATPTFSPGGGSINPAQTVTISCATPNVSLRYTLDGSDPTEVDGMLYSGPFLLSNSASVKALAYRTNLTASPVATATYNVSTNTANPDDFLGARFTAVMTNSGILFHATNNYKGSAVNLYVDIYQPSGDTVSNRPVVMLIHGGGFRTSGVRNQSYIVTFANEFARRGYVAMSIDYRQRSGTDMPTTADELPALKDAAADALTALKWIRDPARAATYGYDPNLVFIAGGSAGGRITTVLACRETGDMGGLPTMDPYSTTSPPSSVTSDANAVYDRTGCLAAAVLWGGPEPEYRCYTVDSTDLPCILIHGTYDVTLQTEGSPVLYRALVEAGVPAQLNLVNGYDHSLGTTTTASADAKPQAAAWMAEFFVQEWKRKQSGMGLANAVASVTSRPGEGLVLQAPFSATYPAGVAWRKDGVTLAGKTNATLDFSSVGMGDAGRYEAVITTPLNSWSGTSIAALEMGNTQISSVSYDTGANSYSHPEQVVVAVADVSVAALGTTFYVDSVNGNDALAGTSQATAWKSLSRVNSTTFLPGDVICFKAGGNWKGTLRPIGSGTAAAPILIDSYGTGAKPVIDGNGVVESGTNYGGAVHLHNQSFWEIQNLEVVNDATTDGLRRGIHVTASNYGTMEHIVIRNCTIRNIRGRLSTSDGDIQSKRTGGIIVETLDDSTVPTRFHDVLIENNVITTVRNQGIVAAGNRVNMSDYPNTPAWHARKVTQLVIRGNTISDVTKNAVILRLADSTGLVERNLCFNTATLDTGNTMFTASCDGSVFQYNEGYSNNATARDGSLYDADLRSTGIIFQYSYSHDNGHGLFWQYPSASGPNSNIIVRYNVSRNDRGNIFSFSGDAGGASTTLIHNNVVYLPPGSTNLIIDARSGNHTYTFANNIFYLEGEGVAYDTAGHAATFDSNVFFGAHPVTEPSDARKITADPKLVNPGSGGIGLTTLTGYQLQSGSPCIKTGTTSLVSAPGPYDFFGNNVSVLTGLDIGVHQSAYSPPVAGPSFASFFPGQTATSDADGDGLTALAEYVLGGSSSGNDVGKLPQPVWNGTILSITVVERTNDAKISTIGQVSEDLSSWSSAAVNRTVDANQTDVPAGFSRVTYSVSMGAVAKAFIRLDISLNP